MELDEADIACLLRDKAVEGLVLDRWLLTFVTSPKKRQRRMLKHLHRHDGSSLEDGT